MLSSTLENLQPTANFNFTHNALMTQLLVTTVFTSDHASLLFTTAWELDATIQQSNFAWSSG